MEADVVSDRPTDVAVVGAGPAGAAAALAAAEAGCRVTVLDTYRQPGGQYLREPDVEEAGHRTAAGHRKGAGPDLGRLPARVRAHPRIDLRLARTVWAATPGPPHTLHADPVDASSSGPVSAHQVVVATGAVDRVLPFPGWDLPGVFTAGAAQALLEGQDVLAGRRSVVAGSGPFLLPVAAGLAGAGCDVALVAEAARPRAWAPEAGRILARPARLAEVAGYATTLARHRVPVRHGRAVVAARGSGRVEEVTVARLDRRWAPMPAPTRTLAVDAVCASFGFVPQVDLALGLGCDVRPDPQAGDPVVVTDGDQATSVTGVFAAGEVTGVAGAPAAAAEGAVAGLAAARAAGRLSAPAFESATRRPRGDRDRHRSFAAALARVYGIRSGWVEWLTADTVVCRCEEVPYSHVRQAVDEDGAADLRSVKMTTRCGMGPCQARMCGPALSRLLDLATGGPPADPLSLSSRPITSPVTLQTIARADAPADAPQDAGGESAG